MSDKGRSGLWTMNKQIIFKSYRQQNEQTNNLLIFWRFEGSVSALYNFKRMSIGLNL